MEDWEYSYNRAVQNWEYTVVQLLPSEGATEIIVDGHSKVRLPWPTHIEYKQFKVIPDRYIEFLNEFGKDGWEMVNNHAPGESFGHYYLFKRPLAE